MKKAIISAPVMIFVSLLCFQISSISAEPIKSETPKIGPDGGKGPCCGDGYSEQPSFHKISQQNSTANAEKSKTERSEAIIDNGKNVEHSLDNSSGGPCCPDSDK